VGISPATLWEYRRGNFPLPLSLLRRLCEAVGEDAAPGERLWRDTERHRFLDRGYPEALAEFWVLCGRQGLAENRLLKMGLSTATVRRLRYLELTPWSEVEAIARKLCRGDGELDHFKSLWTRDEAAQRRERKDGFGPRLQQLRKQQGVTRRELADLFGIGGKKPARIIKYIEEDGFYSAQAHPAGLVAFLAGGTPEEARLLQLWQQRRRQFHRRHRPETRIDHRLARELYGFELPDMEPVLGYSNLEYQKIERGVSPLLDSACDRILQAIHQAGQARVQTLLKKRQAVEAERGNWQSPPNVVELFSRLARREGGLVPLARLLNGAGVKGTSPARLRQIVQGKEVPAWFFIEQVGKQCGVGDLDDVRQDWHERFRAQLQRGQRSPLGVELRVLMAEVATTMRAFSPRLGFNYSVLVRDMQRIDRDQPVKWFHVERIMKARGLSGNDELWREIRAWWYTASERRRPSDKTAAK
jgi:transcriptional regulator with XRE-family HTH domain